MAKALAVRAEKVDEWATRITGALNATVEGIFQTAEHLAKAKAALNHGEWQHLFTPDAHGVRKVPMSDRTAQRYLSIRQSYLLVDASKRTHGSVLPTSWRTLAELAALPEDVLKTALAEGRVTPDMERKDVAKLKALPAPAVEDEAAYQPKPNRHPDWSGLDEAHYRLKALAAEDVTRDALERAWQRWPEDAQHVEVFATVIERFLQSARQLVRCQQEVA